jgi:acyl carrier protein
MIAFGRSPDTVAEIATMAELSETEAKREEPLGDILDSMEFLELLLRIADEFHIQIDYDEFVRTGRGIISIMDVTLRELAALVDWKLAGEPA